MKKLIYMTISYYHHLFAIYILYFLEETLPTFIFMVETAMAMGFSLPKNPLLYSSTMKLLSSSSSSSSNTLKMFGGSDFSTCYLSRNSVRETRKKAESWKIDALPDLLHLTEWPLMAVTIEHAIGQKDYLIHKSVWHLNDKTLKNIYTMYIFFTCWGCCYFGSTKDPFYDSDEYRKDGGDGTVHWIYERQEDLEEEARSELLREELIEEIELKVGGLRELDESSKEEEVVQ